MSQELPPSGSPKAKGSRSPKISRFMNTLRRSPAILRKRLGSGTNSRKDAHHDKKRTDKPEKNEDPKFYVQYLGCKEVSTLRFRQCKDVVEHLFETSKTLSGKDAVKCNVCIRRKYIDIDIIVSKEHIQVAIHNIAYCAADMKHPKVFAFIAKDTTNSGLLHCYAFLCNKPENAQSMTLCLSKSFESAFVEWQLAKSRHDLKVNRKPAAQHKDTNNEAPRRVKHHQEQDSSDPDSSDGDEDIMSPEEEAEMHHEFTRRESMMRRPTLLSLGNILEEHESDVKVKEFLTEENSSDHENLAQLHL